MDVHTCARRPPSVCLGKWKDARRVWIPDILWILQLLFYEWDCLKSAPVAECIAGHTQTEFSLSSEDSPVLRMRGFAHVCSLRNAVLLFTHYLWLFLWFFPELFSYIIMAVFFSVETEAILIRKALSLCKLRKHKHMPKEFQGNNLTSWLKLEASCMKRGRPHTTFPWSLQGTYRGTPSDAIPLTLGYLGQLAVEECCVFVWCCWNLNYAILCSVFCKTNEGPWTEQQLFLKSLNRVVVLGLAVWSVQAFFISLLYKPGLFEVHLLVTKPQKHILLMAMLLIIRTTTKVQVPSKSNRVVFHVDCKVLYSHRAIACDNVINIPKRTATPRLFSSSCS